MTPISPSHSDDYGLSPRQTLTFWSAGRQGALPVTSVMNISIASAATPIPFGPPAFEGVVAHDGMITPQIDWVAHWGGTARSGIYRMRVQTSRGPVWFRVDSLALPGNSPSGGALPMVAEAVAETVADMESLVSLLAVAGDDPNPPLPFANPQDHEVTLLVTETQGRTVALPAAAVLRVERPAQVWTVRAGQPSERQVALTDGLMAGVSLGHWLGYPVPVAAENAWALVVTGSEGRVAILTASLQGLVSLPPHRLRRMVRGSDESFWFLDAQRGAIEVLDPATMTGRLETGPALGQRLKPPVPLPLDTRNPAERRRGLDAKRGLMARVGPYTCLFPAAMLLRVIRQVDPDQIHAKRRAGDYPVVDLARLLGLEPSGTQGRALLVKHRGRQPLVILADEVTLCKPDLKWRPFPAVPLAVHELFAAIAQEEGQVWLLLREGLFQGRSNPAASVRIREAVRGWIEAS